MAVRCCEHPTLQRCAFDNLPEKQTWLRVGMNHRRVSESPEYGMAARQVCSPHQGTLLCAVLSKRTGLSTKSYRDCAVTSAGPRCAAVQGTGGYMGPSECDVPSTTTHRDGLWTGSSGRGRCGTATGRGHSHEDKTRETESTGLRPSRL
ncbi:hypothetical protein CB1_000309001 [Camelus ferus]|nr:hypothetical protein CB1_000309001 [Camelus ferus]